MNFHLATALGGVAREVWVYTPPGYDQDADKRYPVFYLLHGSNDSEFYDYNLLAAKKARATIVVTPFRHATPIEARHPKNTALFETYLLKDVLPMIESTYCVAPGKEHRAIA